MKALSNKPEPIYLTPEEVEEFRCLIKETKGIVLTPEEALDQGSRAIMLMELFGRFQPIQLCSKDIVENRDQKAKNANKI